MKKNVIFGLLTGLAVVSQSVAFAQSEAKADLSKYMKAVSENTTLSGLIEVTGVAGNDFDDKDFSDIALSTAQFAFDTQVNDWISGHMLFLYEEDASDSVGLDEATITLGGSENMPAFLTLGKMYVPFGVLESSMISDSFTLSLAETNQTAAQFGFRKGGVHASAYAFNCDSDKASDQEPDQIECFGATAGYNSGEGEGLTYALEASYLSNIADTDGMQGFMEENELTLKSRTGAYGLFAKLGYQNIALIGEMIAGTDDLEFVQETRKSPLAWNAELNYSLSLMGKDSLFALGYQASEDLAGFLPESRVISSFGMGIADGVTAAIEYAHDSDYDEVDGGTGNTANTVSAQLALEF